MTIIDKEFENEYKEIGYSKEEVMKKFCPTDKAQFINRSCREDEYNLERCFRCWNRKC